jgi:hypothetical protein
MERFHIPDHINPEFALGIAEIMGGGVKRVKK